VVVDICLIDAKQLTAEKMKLKFLSTSVICRVITALKQHHRTNGPLIMFLPLLQLQPMSILQQENRLLPDYYMQMKCSE
jgi:hypothetical protein